MPHKPKYKHPELEIGDEKMQVECRACGWKWYPIPRRWRNRSNMTSDRALKCPQCGANNWVKLEDVKRIWQMNY
jgi:Zn finger protein HypA/HybF involved in hydrogenase expression